MSAMILVDKYEFPTKSEGQMQEAPKPFFFTPAAVALILLITFVALYIAYRWYVGANTVPAPSYITGGFQNPENRTAKLPPGTAAAAKEGFAESTKKAAEFFTGTASSASVASQPRPAAPKQPGVEGTDMKSLDTFGVITDAKSMEGFYGGAARGTGSPDCLRSSSEGAALIDLFLSAGESTVVEGGDDLRELTQIVGKLSCFKKDLLSPSYIVDATRKLEFVTMHDIEPIAETTGRCFAKTISTRDLEIAFDKWTTRGELLIRRLCTAFKLSPEKVTNAQNLFRTVLRDVKDIARSACFVGEPTIAGKPGPRDPHAYENPDAMEYSDFKGYY
jgi:hypothetical protein